MRIGVINEENESRVAIGPDVAKQFIAANNELLIQSGAGEGAQFSDSVYTDAGAQVLTSREEVLKQAELVVTYQPLDASLWKHLQEQAVMVSMFQTYVDDTIQQQLAKESFTVFSLDMIPRTTLAQAMDVLSSMGSIAGYRAIFEAANHLPRYFPMLSTAAGTVAPAKVLVLGAGVAGLQAIATAKRLGAIVEAFDTRGAAKEEVESLGARFVEVEGAIDDKDAGGYAVDQSAEYKKKQQQMIRDKAAIADVVITTAQVRGPKAPLLIPKETVERMRPGSVIVDLAASTGGNCELTKSDELVKYKGVTIVGNSNLAAKVPLNASQMFGKNVFNFLKPMLKEGVFEPDWENIIVSESCIVKPDMATA